jgi:hypothetical protein
VIPAESYPPFSYDRVAGGSVRQPKRRGPSVSWACQVAIQFLASLLDYPIELLSFLFLQRAETPNLTNKNKEAVGVALEGVWFRVSILFPKLLNTKTKTLF